VVLDTRPDWGVVEGLVREAYRHVATRKLAARLAAGPPPARAEDRRR
jgi:hypothetical protein